MPIVRLDDLSDEERKAYTLVHNKLTMNSGYDFEKLEEELDSIDSFDMSDFGFSDLEQQLSETETPNEFKEFDEDIETKNKCPKCGYEW